MVRSDNQPQFTMGRDISPEFLGKGKVATVTIEEYCGGTNGVVDVVVGSEVLPYCETGPPRCLGCFSVASF